ncbi:muscle M-line assembly protein unc-89-like [Saccostrea cucullata]|uniref:muscle M-line assembly protein unc-89-like n=1 Tax=Saccostrea cuccullata TaxID=36930 RepID=UPI002ED014EA
MAMVTHNGQTIGITEYVSLIIEAARKIIEKEQRENGILDKSGLSIASTDAQEDRLTSSESESSKEMAEVSPNSLDTNSVKLRLPDGTLQSVEDYIIGIIKDASDQIEKERQNASIRADDTLDKSAVGANVQTPLKTEPSNTCEKDSTPKAAKAKVSSPKQGPVSKVLNRIFKRGKTKEREKATEEIINGFDDSLTSERGKEENSSPSKPEEKSPVKPEEKSPVKPEPNSPNSVHNEEITVHTENHESPSKDNKQEIPKGKVKVQKKNSLRKMLSCFSSKAAQAD